MFLTSYGEESIEKRHLGEIFICVFDHSSPCRGAAERERWKDRLMGGEIVLFGQVRDDRM